MVPPSITLHLARHAETAWREVIRPWLEQGRGRLERTHVVVPTRGQAHAFKQRCLVEGVPLLGVEFLTPGLARKKWLAEGGSPNPSLLRTPTLGRELLLLGLRTLIERRLAAAALSSDHATWGLWKSLQSDPERALDDFDELLKAGFRTGDFPLAPLGDIFTDLTAWAERLGYTLAPLQSEAAALSLTSGAPPICTRLLVSGLSAEAWGEFFNVAALARRSADVTVILPEPELRGAKALDEAWVEVWQALLGVEARLLGGDEPESYGAKVAALWAGGGSAPSVMTEGEAQSFARLIIGETRSDEMILVADELGHLLQTGAENIAVIFPRADAAHVQLARLLEERGLPFADLLEVAGAPPIDLQIQRGLLAFYEHGARLEELLELWPLLHALNLVKEPLRVAREVCERLFDEGQTHALAAYQEKLVTSERPGWREVGRIAAALLPAWPAELTLVDALARFEIAGKSFGLTPPAGWPALSAFAQRETERLPARVIYSALASFLPQASPAVGIAGRGVFARITLTTRRRAIGIAWSHVVVVESNAGVWPERRDSSCWLTDDQRRELNRKGRFTLGLFTGDDRAALEKQAWMTLARDTREQIIFSAALFDEEEPELRLAPNAWLERIMLAQGRISNPSSGLEEAFAALARKMPAVMTSDPGLQKWHEVWNARRDPTAPFDEYFFSGPVALTRPTRLAARLIERGVQDPVELWFEAVLRVRQVGWAPLARTRKKALGQLVHRVLAEALRGTPAEGIFVEKPAVEIARAQLAAALTRLRGRWPHDRYWDSFHGELHELARALLEKVYVLNAGVFLAIEANLPNGATIPLGPDERLEIHGRMDLALLDRPAWGGARVDIVDFKTGTDARLSSERMARGVSLQLGIYLAAVASVGTADARVWMLKPEAGGLTALELADLERALAPLTQLGQHLATGRYGALTPDRTDFSHGYEWPLACTPVRHAILQQKFAVTFGGREAVEEEESGDE